MLLQADGPSASFGQGRLVAQGEADHHDNLVASLNLYSSTDSRTVANQRGERGVAHREGQVAATGIHRASGRA